MSKVFIIKVEKMFKKIWIVQYSFKITNTSKQNNYLEKIKNNFSLLL